MIACLDANYQDARFSRETPEGQQRFAKLQQCHLTLKNVANTPSIELLSLLTTYGPILSDLAALHSESRPDSINHPALALLHRDVSELLTDALDATAKFATQPFALQVELQAVIRRKLRSRSSMSSSTTVSSPAAVIATLGTSSGSKSGAEVAAAAASLSLAEHDGGARSVSSPPPHSATPATNSGIREDSLEMASACLRSAPCAACSCGVRIRDTCTGFSLSTDLTGESLTGAPRFATACITVLNCFLLRRCLCIGRVPHTDLSSPKWRATPLSKVLSVSRDGSASHHVVIAPCLYVCWCVGVFEVLDSFVLFLSVLTVRLLYRGASALSAQAKTTLMCVLLPKF